MENEVTGQSFQQLLAAYEATQQQQNTGAAQNNAGQGLATAGKEVGAVSGAIGLGLQAIPGFGTIAGAVVGGVGALASGFMELAAANKQKAQAASNIAEAKSLRPNPLPPGLLQKAQADQMAAGSPMPGWTQYHDALQNNLALHLRSIYNNSRNGGQAVSAVATSLGINNEGMSRLFAENAAYQAKQGQQARNDLWDIGLAQHQGEQELFNNYQKPLFQQATALQNAATANKQTAINTITGTVGSTAANIGGQIDKNQLWDDVVGRYQTQKAAVDPITTAGAGTQLTSATGGGLQPDLTPAQLPYQAGGVNQLWQNYLPNSLGGATGATTPFAIH